jgi:hypothetical protein
MNLAVNTISLAVSQKGDRRSVSFLSAFRRFKFSAFTQSPFSLTPGQATGSFNGPQHQSKFPGPHSLHADFLLGPPGISDANMELTEEPNAIYQLAKTNIQYD